MGWRITICSAAIVEHNRLAGHALGLPPTRKLFVDALTALLSRTSSPLLKAPGPDAEALENIYKAAFRAADHGLLKPWRFLSIQGDSLVKLGELFVRAATEDNPDITAAKIEKLQKKPLRAPLIVVTIASAKEHPKVPAFEQELSAAAATQNMLIAAHAQGVGAMWRTGSMAFHPTVMSGLGLQSHEKIIGFLYLGSHEGPERPPTETTISDHVSEW